MSQERLDQTCRLPVGTKDAIHVPFAVATWDNPPIEDRIKGLKPGSYVRFTDEKYTKFALCEKAEAHGVVNPFLDEISFYSPVVVLVKPGITTPVRHHFDINPALKDMEQKYLEAELERAREEDPECAGCWVIQNNEIVRM